MNPVTCTQHKISIQLKAIIAFLISINGLSLYAQDEKWSVNAGIGNIENLNVGIESYFSKRNSIAVTFGFLHKSSSSAPPISELYKCTAMLNHQFYLGFSRRKKGLPTWYLGDRIGYVYSTSAGLKTGYFDILLVAGRKIFFTPKFGLNIDAGGGIGILHMEPVQENVYTNNDSRDFLIEMRIQLFYRF